MLDDVKLIHAALIELETHLEGAKQTVPIARARVLASRLHRRMHEAVLNNAERLDPDVVAFSGSIKP